MAERPRADVMGTLRRASTLVPGFSRGLKLTVLLASGGALGRLVLPVLLQRTINRGFRDTGVDVDAVLRYCTIALIVTVVCELSARLASYRLGTWSEWLMATLRERCVDRLLAISMDQHARQRKGVLVARVTSDVESIARFFEWGAISWLINSLILVVLSGYLLFTDWRLGLLAMVVASPVALVMIVVQRRMLRAYEKVRAHIGAYLARTGEIVGGAGVIRAYRAQDVMRSSADLTIENRRRAQVRTGFLGALLFPAGELFASAAVSAVVLAALAQGLESGLGAGTIVGVIFATIRLLDPVGEIAENVDQTQMAVAGLSRVLDVIDLPVDLVEPAQPVDVPAGNVGMRIEAVSYVYPERPEGSVEQLLVTRDRDEVDTAWTIQDVDLDVPAGRSLALVGATGSGKSTLALLLVRLADPQRGRVCLAGIDLREISDVELRRRVQLVPQEPFLFVGSIAENLRRGRAGASDAKLSAAITRLGLEDWISGLPSGLDTQVGERGSGLSAGERQLVALLRAEVMGPDVLILDEATSSVDAAMEARLARTIEVLAQGRTMVVIAHRLSTAARSDRIAVMAHGRLVQTGTHAELVDAEGPYAHIASEWTKGVRV